MPSCSAIGCKNRHSMEIKGVTFHRFPRDPYRRQQWILAVRRADWMPSAISRLCSMHFEEHMFNRSSNLRVHLKSHAVPTIFKGEGFPTIANQELLKPKIEILQKVLKPKTKILQELPKPKVDILEDISNDKNRILVVPEGLDVQAAFYDNDDKNNVVIINEEDLETVLNYGNEEDIDDNRAIIVSDGRDTKNESCGNVGEDSYLSGEILPYDPKFGEESLKSECVDFSKVRTVLAYDPDFYVRRVKKLDETVKNLRIKKKRMHQITRRRRRRIVMLRKQVKRRKRSVLPPKCSTRPIVHVISQVVDD